MTEAIPKIELFIELGFGGDYELLEAALEEAGLSRPDKTNIAARKADAVRRVLLERFVPVCSRGDCAEEAGALGGRRPVPASDPGGCAVCGGSANARAVDEMVAALRAAGLSRLCVVGGSPNSRVELQRLVGGRLELRLVDGTMSRTRRQARGDLAWADLVLLWGGTILAHKVSRLYQGGTVIQMARRSIQELAREAARAAGSR